MLIRAAQMKVFEIAAEEDFIRRIGRHLLENYARSIVRLPENIESTVGELEPEKLRALVEIAVARARFYELIFESSIAGFVALMFAVAPNFDADRTIRKHLRDENIEHAARLDEALQTLSENDWKAIRARYDPDAWQPQPALNDEDEDADN